MKPLIIIGTGLAGYTLAKEWRKLVPEGPLILITADEGNSYSKPMLSTGYAKGKSADDLIMTTMAAMAVQLKAEIIQNRVLSLNAETRQVSLEDGQVLQGSEVVLALGADPFRPSLGGDASATMHSVNDLGDYRHLQASLSGARRVTILGGGLIGCEFAHDLRTGGYDIDLVEPAGRLLPSLLPEVASLALASALQEQGIRLHLGQGVSAINHKGSNLRVTLSHGSVLEADVVLSAVGLRPRIALAQTVGLSCQRGIQVNRYLECSVPGWYALGDCAEVEGLVLPYVLPLMAQARALAKTLAGNRTAVHYPAMPVVVKTPSCPVVVAPVAAQTEGSWELEAEGGDVRALFYDPSQRLLGFVLMGRWAQQSAEKSALQKMLPDMLATL
ncbi:MAG: FAD-dependent oxidoreductase [Pseudomonadales bacterium]|nr:FAD-dependent oxidoreductase [Pseudomonadales bacterium]